MTVALKKVLITGGTRGIGRELAEALSRAGAEVIICGRNTELLQRIRGDLGVRALRCDVTDPQDLGRLEQAVRGELGGLDILINNAGVQFSQNVVDGLEPGLVSAELAVNLEAPIQVTSRLLPLLLGSSSPLIVNVTSALALAPSPRSPIYAASKAGLVAWTHALRLQLEATDVRVLEVVPPVVATSMTEGRQDGAMQPGQVADAVVQAIEGRRERVAIGKARLFSVINRLSPRLGRRIMASR